MGDRYLLYAACDAKYFLRHGKAFVLSAYKNNIDTSVIIVMNSELNDERFEVFHLASDLNRYTNNRFMYIYTDMPNVSDQRVYFATLRFLRLHNILNIAKNMDYSAVWVSDIDSIIMKDIHDYKFVSSFSDDEKKNMGGTIGVYLREKNQIGSDSFEKDGMKIAAGLLVVSTIHNSFVTSFVETLQNRIKQGPQRWFIDQIALYDAYNKTKLLSSGFCFDIAERDILDWEFEEGSYIWTGKGPRKDHNKKYLEEKKKYDDIVISSSEESL